MTYQFKIQIKDITRPPVWRRVTVPDHFTFLDFHNVIQVAFGWENDHLFLFSHTGYSSYPQIKVKYKDDMSFFFDKGEVLEASKIKLSGIFFKEKQRYVYIYDFGDNWIHSILLEKILPEKTLHPNCLAGKGKCPPEDCGGAWGFMELRDILDDKTHPEYEEYKDWYFDEGQEEWDAAAFNLKKTQERILKLFSRK